MTTDPVVPRTAERITQELRAVEYTLMLTLPGTPEHTVATRRVKRLTDELLAAVEVVEEHHADQEQ